MVRLLKLIINSISNFYLRCRIFFNYKIEAQPESNTEKVNFPESEHQRISDQYEIIDDLEIPNAIQYLLTNSTLSYTNGFWLVKNASLIGKCAIALDSERNILLPSTIHSKEYLMKSGDSKWLLANKFLKQKESYEYAISFVNVLSTAYFHWVTEVLSGLRYWFYLRDNMNIESTIFVATNPPAFQIEYLELLGIPRENIEFWDRKTCQVNNLILPFSPFTRIPTRGCSGFNVYHRSGFDWLKGRLKTKPQLLSEKGRRFYISRSDSNRIIRNEEEVLNMLDHYDVQKIVLGGMSVSNQIEIFENAELIVAPHGAGLVNMIFSKKCSVIELFPASRNMESLHVFFQISTMYVHDHKVIISQSDTEENQTVDIKILESVLEKHDN